MAEPKRMDIQEIYDLLLLEGYQEKLFQDLRLQTKKVRTERAVSKGGRETIVNCPFCGGDNFSYNDSKPVWKCWKCGKGGDWAKYLEQREGLLFPEALSRLAMAAGVEVSPDAKQRAAERARRADIYEIAQELFSYNIQHVPGKHIRDYLQKVRGYSPAEIEGMELGAYTAKQELQEKLLASGFSEPEIQESGLLAYRLGEEYQLSILWRDRAGQALGYAFRLLPETEQKEPELSKYRNTPGLDKSQGLIGLSLARGAESLLLVEGQLDALLLNTKGVPTVALGGTSLSPDILKSLERSRTKELILALDRDKAGQEATLQQSCARLLEYLQQRTLHWAAGLVAEGP